MSLFEDKIPENVFSKYLRILKSNKGSKRAQVWNFVFWQTRWSNGPPFQKYSIQKFPATCSDHGVPPYLKCFPASVSYRHLLFETLWIHFVKCGLIISKFRNSDSGFKVMSGKIVGNFSNSPSRITVCWKLRRDEFLFHKFRKNILVSPTNFIISSLACSDSCAVVSSFKRVYKAWENRSSDFQAFSLGIFFIQGIKK